MATTAHSSPLLPNRPPARSLAFIRRQQAKNYGYVAGGIQTGDALCHTLTDIIEMRCLTTNHAAENDHGVVTVVERHLVSTVDQFKRTGNGLHVDILGQGTVLLKRGNAAVEQRPGNLGIPLGDNHTEGHIRCVGHLLCIIL